MNECIVAFWVELNDVSHTFEKKRVTMFACSSDQLIELAISTQHVCVPLIRGQVDSKCNKLFTNDWLGTVNDELINEWDTIRVSECSLRLVLQTQMVKQLDNLCSESRCLQRINQLWNHALIIHLNTNFLVE